MYDTERLELAEKLYKKGIKDKSVLKAIAKVERHKFVPDALNMHAYKDKALPIGFGQTISQPYTVAFMTQALQVGDGDKVLEIGTGSGYQAAILAHMGVQVFSIERQYDIYQRTQKLIDEMSLRVHAKYGDGTLGWAEFAPYDGIIVTAGAPVVPESLKKQLAVDGRLVIPVGDRNSQSLEILRKKEDGTFEQKSEPQFVFVPLIGREGWQEE